MAVLGRRLELAEATRHGSNQLPKARMTPRKPQLHQRVHCAKHLPRPPAQPPPAGSSLNHEGEGMGIPCLISAVRHIQMFELSVDSVWMTRR